MGYRLYRNLDTVNSDSSGNALINIWPPLREVLVDNEPLVLNNSCRPLQAGDQQADVVKRLSTLLTRLSFQITVEYR